MQPTGFDSWKQFSDFSLAREFIDRKTGEPFETKPLLIETVGGGIASVVLRPLNAVLREIRNPAVIAGLTTAALLMAAIVFYPAHTVATLTRVLPFLKHVNAGHIKAALYVLSQSMIAGIGLRTLGRLSNPELMDAFNNRKIVAVPIGAVRI